MVLSPRCITMSPKGLFGFINALTNQIRLQWSTELESLQWVHLKLYHETIRFGWFENH